MLPRQTRRKTTFGRPVRVKVCPIIEDLPLRATCFSHGLGERAGLRESQVREIVHSGLLPHANLLFFLRQ
jgi:hypothetical protein